ncbi:hypothetical protein [Dongia sedimenti]|uniref:Uncharacterized protein n=1 Tax=Dongia sedimenti TaxID=3064282 RepID=A0ABU0YS65_9PROT|nr:hypothetical protein [Rhodospirillaceae bacterium R-7]
MIEDFFAAIEPFEAAHRNCSFSYLAVKHESAFVLVQGVIYLTPFPKLPHSHFTSENVWAGRYLLADLGQSARELVRQLLLGRVSTPQGEVVFPTTQDGAHSAWMQPFHPIGLQNQNRTMVLQIKGGDQQSYIRQPFFDWELKAASMPFDSLQELTNEYGVGGLFNDRVTVEIYSPNMAAVDFTSPIAGTEAEIVVRLANGLLPDNFALGIKILHQGRVTERRRRDGRDFRWSQEPDFQRGTLAVTIPEAAVLQCVASYNGVAQHFGWLADPTTTQNPRRAVYETFDPQLALLSEICNRPTMRGQQARDLESAVAWLLWILGFSVTQLGNTPSMQDAADLLATAPTGHFGVVEVTTGMLKAENKLSLLHDRAQAVRRNLELSGFKNQRILTIMVTSQPRSDVEVDLDQAEKLGILVMTREDLNEMIQRSRFPQNADRLFEEAEGRTKAALAKYNPQPLTALEGGA